MNSSVRHKRILISNNSKERTLKKAQFYASYRRYQEWYLPDSIIYYITKNPSTPKAYQKLVQACKHFFVKKPIIVAELLCHWVAINKEDSYDIDETDSLKIWVTRELVIWPEFFEDRSFLSSTLPILLYRCDCKRLRLKGQTITFNELLFISSSAESIEFNDVTVKNDEDGSIVPLEKVVGVVSYAKRINIYSNFYGTAAKNISSSTVKELLKIPHFSKLESLFLNNIPEFFDIDTFYAYMKTNKFTDITINFANSVSNAYQNKLETIIDEIIEAHILDFKPPAIFFHGVNDEKYQKLYHISRNTKIH